MPSFMEYGLPLFDYGSTGSGGTGAVPYADLTQQLNALMANQARGQYESNLPNYTNLVSQRSANIASDLSGEVAPDVLRNIQNAGAARGIATGSPGSQNANASWLQALGLTSQGLKQQGSENLSKAIADTPVAQLFNPASLFVPQTLAREELAAAQAGLGTGATTRSGGGSGGSNIQLPGGSLGRGAGWGQPASWERSGGAAYGATGVFDNYTAPSSYVGNVNWNNTPTSNVSNFNDPYDPGYWAGDEMPTTYTPGNTVSDWSNIGNVDWSQYE